MTYNTRNIKKEVPISLVVSVGPAVPTVSTVPLGNSYEEKDSKIKYMMAYYNFQ